MPALQILHLLPSVSDAAAGLAHAVEGLSAAQRQTGLEASVLGTDQLPDHGRVRGLEQRAAGMQLIHSHGLWLAASRASRRLRHQGLPTVVAPHGMLDPWALRRRRPLKQLLWWLGEQRTLQSASCLQALCNAELEAIRGLGISAPVAVIANGVALPDRSVAAIAALPPAPWLAHGVPAGAPVLLFLGRFHAKKGLAPLLSAWTQLQASAPTGQEQPWLVLAGFGDGGQLAAQLQCSPIPQLCLVGAVQGPAKASAFAQAKGFVLPSFSEGLPMAALEAMAWGLPCLLSPACNLPGAFAAGAAWSAPANADQLLPVLQRWRDAVLHDPAELKAMGEAGHALVASSFCWSAVAAQTVELYGWLLDQGPKPEAVDV
jgi:glycosyltransferase involved in cell wall biosynthesis